MMRPGNRQASGVKLMKPLYIEPLHVFKINKDKKEEK